MQDLFEKVEELTGHLREYVNLKIERIKISIAETSSAIIANLVAGIIVAVFLFFFLLFVSLAGAYALSAWIGKPWAGFLIVAGFYLLLGVVVWMARERIIRVPVMNAIIRQFFKNEKEETK
jgi:putative superfamily III holin-X